MSKNYYEDKAFKDKVYDDAKKDNYEPPFKPTVLTDIVNGVTGIYDSGYINNQEYREEYEKAKDALNKK